MSSYLTPADVLSAPLGIALSSLPGANPGTSPVLTQQVYEQLIGIIARASGMVDNYVEQVLAATLDTEEKWTTRGLAWIDNNGYLNVHADYWPVLSVQSFQYGYPTLGGTSWTAVTLSDLIVSRERITYPGAFLRRGTPPLRVQYTYLNGWPNTLLAATVAAGVTSLPVADATGMVAGGKLTIYDQGNTEVVTVAAGWAPVQGAASVTLQAATQFAHSPVLRPVTGQGQPYDIAVSALPEDVRQATLLVVKSIVETRGASALVMGRAGRVSGPNPADLGTAEKMPNDACLMLDRYRRVL
jgi:hypothetical protein